MSVTSESADSDLQPGQPVGEYVVDAKIGEGGFGTVFRAEQPEIGKRVAIKVLARQYSVQDEMVERFKREARAVNQIRHRNIIDIFSFGQLAEPDGRHYYVMEYLDGHPLDELLNQRGRLAMAEAIPILRAIARALDAAHAKGIAHRDLKPENVFIAQDPDGTLFPKLLDFGIAKLLGDKTPQQHKTRTGAPIGTPAYMSPEQCRGRDVDHRTDIYAFGILAYELLAGEVPFDGEDYMEILLKQIQDEPAPPSSVNPELPASVDQGILWMLAKDPAARPPNLVTAVRALEDAATSAGIPIPAGPAPSGVYATPTGTPMAAQPTPSAVSPLPPKATTRQLGAKSVATAETIDASGLSAELEPIVVPRSKAPLLVGAVLAAVVAGAVVFLMTKGGGDEPSEPTPAAAIADPAPIEPPAPAPAAAPADAAPVLPAVVTIEIQGPPPGTEVYGPLGPLGIAPGKVQLERGDQPIILTFKADGYVTTTAEVVPEADTAIEVELDEKRRHRTRPKKKTRGKKQRERDALEDPFAN